MKNVFGELRSAFSLQHDRASNDEIHLTMISGATVKGTNLFILILAIFIASIGLNMNSTAVIIGAMLISPLMGGIMAIGYGLATNNIKLVKKAFLGLIFQVLICIATSTLYFNITPISSARSELLARTMPTIWDVMIAICGGLAGVIGVTRKERSNVIPGVAIATALMPPLCTVGYGLAMGNSRFVFGALYLFVINSLFICISTFLIIRLMQIPKKKFVDEATQKKGQRYATLIALITIVPSIFLAAQIVSDSVRDSNLQRYIDKELVFENTQVVSTSLIPDAKELRIALIGQRISSDTISLLENKLSQYSLGDYVLRVTQSEKTETLDSSDVESLIEKELSNISHQLSLGDREQEIEYLKSELVKYKTQVLDYQSTDYDIQTLTKEIKALFSQIKTFSIGRHKVVDPDTDEVIYEVIATIEASETLTPGDRTRIENWISVKTDTPVVKLFVSVTPVITPVVPTQPVVPTFPLPSVLPDGVQLELDNLPSAETEPSASTDVEN